MVLMIIVALALLGLVFGSFVNALVWRLHEQARESNKLKPNRGYLERLSISRGRSMCSQCHHELAVKDLIPVVSWLSLRGKCRYCHKPIPDSPLIELATGAAFVASYYWWPQGLNSLPDITRLGLWLMMLVGLMALVVYDLRWMLLPNRLIYPLSLLAGGYALISITMADRPRLAILNTLLGVLVGGGIFYLLFQLSKGKWIGGGDVKLGWLLGLLVGTAMNSLLMIFLAAVSGSLLSLPLLANGKLKRRGVIPFGPFLIFGCVIVVLFGTSLLAWYQHGILGT